MIGSLMKKDFYINGIYYLIILGLIPLFYVMETDQYYLYFGIMIGFLFNLFYYDHRNHVNRFIGSLPVKLRNVVLSRYITMFSILVCFVLYVWLVDSLAHYGLPYLETQPMTTIEIMILFTFISITISISMPIYYLVKTFMKAIGIQMGLLVFGTFAFAIMLGNEYITFYEPLLLGLFKLIDIQPYVMLILISLLFLYLSYELSAWIYTKKAKV
ncbi:ABC-2 transporter permease [Oceanobacillus kapialis]|uniref:ABC-2 transporter permease n=1 Tax=Oceanobacillus kapialis TaxID=481353 RepID=A0ABW5PZ07_9BACI